MCLFCFTFTDYASSRRTNFDPKPVQKRLKLIFELGKKLSQGGPKMVREWWFPVLNPNRIYIYIYIYCSSRSMLVCQDHDPLQGSSSSAKIMILCKDHDRRPTI